MTIHYSLDCSTITILVKQVEEDGADRYNVNIQSNNNPLSFGNTLISASTQEEAIRIADQLCTFFTMAREHGYHLEGRNFIKPDKADILAEDVLLQRRSKDELMALFMQD
ncbi:hypothetical protein [Paenibacillus spongiae]|uniref:Uncharacterized protein n=1 Tax=Paenibacillus spongiae TaxID=2909671 RepID=A0ABY5S440_9BACL|nr:hypothetical protein [Paenibacillus spongiae]UVI27627.1 hypothetical protein L1F29_19360 [Paenibacillus spongiae]